MLQIKKLLQIKSHAWKLVPSIPLVLRRIKMVDDRLEKELTEGYFHQGYQNDIITREVKAGVDFLATEQYGTFFD